jgi:hypothetical protein
MDRSFLLGGLTDLASENEAGPDYHASHLRQPSLLTVPKEPWRLAGAILGQTAMTFPVPARYHARRLRLGMALALAASAPACAPMLFSDGTPKGDIVIDAGAAADVQKAASEIAAYGAKTAGGTMRVRTADQPSDAENSVRLRILELVEGAGEIQHADGYTIRTSGHEVTITGGSARGVLYGAYDFIERVLGVRWFMPAELGEDIAPQKSIPFPELNVLWNPAFRNVNGLIWAGGPGAAAWELRVRGKIGSSVSFGHNWSNILARNPANLARYPLAFAEVSGRRGSSPQLCSEDPDVVRLSVEAARQAFSRTPTLPLFSISPNDGYGFCEDDRCRRIDARYGVTDGTLSDRFVHYANAVITELRKTHPGKQAGILAYVQHTAPPRNAVPLPEYATLVTHTPWEFCHVHALDDPQCPSNARFTEYLRGWSALTRHAGIYEYYGHFFMFTPWPIVRNLRRDIPFLHSLGVERFTSETQQNWANQGINFYVAARLIADPSTNVDALLAEYYTRFYGAAATPMRRYWERFEIAMADSAAVGDGGYAWISMFRRPLLDAAAADLAEADRLARGDSREIVRQRLAFVRLGFDYTEAVVEMFEAHYRGDTAAVFDWSQKAVDRVRKTEGSAPQAFFVSIASNQTRYLASLLTSPIPAWVQLRP